ncbi:MAG: hypothetical protein NTX16_03205 [Actinobacteria bacterium]|nr:hypothetical protein [Actinomycetota bacterium]
MYAAIMPFDVSAGSFAAAAISALFWWTVLSPLGLLATAVLCARRPRLRLWLTLVILVPPILIFLPVTVMHAGPARAGTAGAAILDLAGVVLAAAALSGRASRPRRAARHASAALVLGIGGGMLGSAALVGALVLA